MEIPNNIVNPHHPLFGTIDHVVPLSAGGRDSLDNRALAHRHCNGRKGGIVFVDIVRATEFAKTVRPAIVQALEQVGIVIHNTQKIVKAKVHVKAEWERRLQPEQHRRRLWAIERWEGEGGLAL